MIGKILANYMTYFSYMILYVLFFCITYFFIYMYDMSIAI